MARPSSKNGLGEGARTIAEAVQTALRLGSEREPEGDLGEGQSESEIEGDLLEFADSPAPALVREGDAEEVRLLPCRR